MSSWMGKVAGIITTQDKLRNN